MQEIIRASRAAMASGGGARLVTIVDVEGSAFRSPGARLLILPRQTIGTISGGCLEAEVAERALAAPADALPAVWRYDTRVADEALLGWGSGCGGAITLLVEELSAASQTIDFIADCHAAGEPAVVALIYESTDPAIARVGDRIHLRPPDLLSKRRDPRHAAAQPPDFFLGGNPAAAPRRSAGLRRIIQADARRILATQRWMSATYEIGSAEVRVLLEPIVPPIRLLICGIGEEARALSHLAKQLGWHVTLADPRLDGARPIGDADRTLDCRPDELIAAAQMPGEFAAVIMTHRLLQDAELLAELLPTRARYIGVLGPQRRLQLLLDTLPGQKISPRQLAKIHGPAGLDIGGEMPAEIALSIAAEIAAVFAGRRGGMLRHRQRGLHAGPETFMESRAVLSPAPGHGRPGSPQIRRVTS
ncbi:MAG TPA: XdhC family protein [Tepidisphaeraceae bacterium]|nr:XdhC family protein [Tepidisphaeraceae bacterium]